MLVHEGQAGDQLPDEDENNDHDVPFDENKNVDGDNNVNGDDVEDHNNDGDKAVPLAPYIFPQFDSKDLYKVLCVPSDATEWQIKILYRNLAKKHHPDCQPINLSKDDAIRTFSFINNTYEILGNREKRRVHDASLCIGEAGNGDEEGNDDEDRDDDEDSDDDDDDDRNFDRDRPPDKDSTSFSCDWAHIFNFYYSPQLQPSKCTTDGCDKFVHQICQNAFEQRQEHSLTTILKCCVHHPHSPFTITKPVTSNVEEKQQSEHVSINTSSSESSSSSSSSKFPTRKGRACSVSGKVEAI